MLKARKVYLSSNGIVAGEYIGILFESDIRKVYDTYSKLWLEQNTGKNGDLNPKIYQSDVEKIDEYTFSEVDHIFIGLPNSVCYEIIDDDSYVCSPICEPDKYGFEQMVDEKGHIIPYNTLDDGMT